MNQIWQELRRNERELQVRASRRDFWNFCKATSPDFYKENRVYLEDYCNVLQALYERRIVQVDVKQLHDNNISYRQIVDNRFFIIEHADDLELLTGHKVITNLMINLPPQHGKSRTLINFCAWCLGKSQSERIITVSYNEYTASDFSKYCRDMIMEETLDVSLVYSDIFPNIEVKRGSASHMKWALYNSLTKKGQHFNYLGTGLGGSITSKSGTIRILDDLIKSAEEAFNENTLDKIWQFYTSTFMSRQSGEHIDIICSTRWADKDVCGRLLELNPDNWFVFKMDAYSKDTDMMLCEELLSRDNYENIKKIMQPEIFYSNYHNITLDCQNKLYTSFKTYSTLPENFDKILCVCDTADTGSDNLAAIVAGIKGDYAYVLDIYYTKEPMEITEPGMAEVLHRNNVNIAIIESNNGGRGFARAVDKILKVKYKSTHTVIRWFHQSKNKQARIFSMSAHVQEYIILPDDWDTRFPEAYIDLNKYSRIPKANKQDDIADVITMLSEEISLKNRVRVLK